MPIRNEAPHENYTPEMHLALDQIHAYACTYSAFVLVVASADATAVRILVTEDTTTSAIGDILEYALDVLPDSVSDVTVKRGTEAPPLVITQGGSPA